MLLYAVQWRSLLTWLIALRMGCPSFPSRYWLPLFVHFTNSWFCKIRLFCSLQVYVLFLLQGGCYFCKIAFFSIAQISDFAKVGYFAQVAYYITMQQALRLHWNHQHLIWVKIQIESFEGSDSIFHRIFQWSQLYLQFKSILASTDTECHSAQKMH